MDVAKREDLIQKLGEQRVNRDTLLSKYTTIRLGGPAQLFYVAKTICELAESIKLSRKLKIPVYLLGGGTNTLFNDNGFEGMVIKNETGGIKFAGIRGESFRRSLSSKIYSTVVFLDVESGVGVNRLVRYTIDQGLSGLETFIGQPGTLGGALWINAHNMKWGTYFGDHVYRAKILTKEGDVILVNKDYFRFGYDSCRIQKTGDVVLSVVLALNRGEKDDLWQTANEVLAYRKATQPQGIFSAGCAFQNIKKSDAIRVSTPNYTRSAGYLLDQVGLKGFAIKGANFSSQHANFLINDGKARSADVVELLALAKKRVYARFGVLLKEEIQLVSAQ